MRDPVTYDDIERLEASTSTASTHREAAKRLLGWAEERNQYDEASPAELVSAAAWHLDQAGDVEGALHLLRRAVTETGTTTPDARTTLVAALIDAGRADEADQVAEQLRRSTPRIIDIASMAEVYEIAGDLQRAHRWVSMGVAKLDRIADTDELESYEVEVLFDARRRVRRELGFPEAELED